MAEYIRVKQPENVRAELVGLAEGDIKLKVAKLEIARFAGILKYIDAVINANETTWGEQQKASKNDSFTLWPKPNLNDEEANFKSAQKYNTELYDKVIAVLTYLTAFISNTLPDLPEEDPAKKAEMQREMQWRILHTSYFTPYAGACTSPKEGEVIRYEPPQCTIL